MSFSRESFQQWFVQAMSRHNWQRQGIRRHYHYIPFMRRLRHLSVTLAVSLTSRVNLIQTLCFWTLSLAWNFSMWFFMAEADFGPGKQAGRPPGDFKPCGGVNIDLFLFLQDFGMCELLLGFNSGVPVLYKQLSWHKHSINETLGD